MGLTLLSTLFFTGPTACEQSEKVIDDAAESAEQAVDKARNKTVEILGSSEGNSKEESGEKE